jgi:hypothetical protein
VEIRRQLCSQAFVRSTAQRSRASGSGAFVRRRRPRQITRAFAGGGCPRGRLRLIRGSIERARSAARSGSLS